MARELFDLVINEISFVDDGANPFADVIFKRRTEPSMEQPNPSLIAKALQGALKELTPMIVEKALAAGFAAGSSELAAQIMKETVMDLEALTKSLEKAEADIAKANSERDDALAKLRERDAEVAKLKGGKSEEDDVLKGLPAAARELIEKSREQAAAATAAVAKMIAEREQEASIAKAKEIGFGDPSKIGPLLHRVEKGMTTADDAKTLAELFKSAATVEKSSPLFKSLGSRANSDADPEEVLAQKAKDIRAATPTLSKEEAYTKALEENPDLYAAYVAKRRGGSGE
jgi:hypothetical protein